MSTPTSKISPSPLNIKEVYCVRNTHSFAHKGRIDAVVPGACNEHKKIKLTSRQITKRRVHNHRIKLYICDEIGVFHDYLPTIVGQECLHVSLKKLYVAHVKLLDVDPSHIEGSIINFNSE